MKFLLAGVSLSVLGGLPQAPALAQDTAAADDAVEIEEIVVTSRRRAERLQDVPATVTAFT